jgi:hypothetical protein
VEYREAIRVLRDAQVRSPALVELNGHYHVFSRIRLLASGATIADALRAGGFLPRSEHRRAIFVSDGLVIKYKGVKVAEAESKSMALRIANALNEYVTDGRAT